MPFRDKLCLSTMPKLMDMAPRHQGSWLVQRSRLKWLKRLEHSCLKNQKEVSSLKDSLRLIVELDFFPSLVWIAQVEMQRHVAQRGQVVGCGYFDYPNDKSFVVGCRKAV